MNDINYKWDNEEYREKEWEVGLYKGEGRIMVNPNQPYASGICMRSKDFIILKDENNAGIIGEAVLFSIKYFKRCPVSKERFSMTWWKGATKYKSWLSFLKNNDAVDVYDRNGEYHIASYMRETENKQNSPSDFTVKIIALPYSATAEEIGQAVLDAFRAAEEYHANLEKENKEQDKE